MQMRSDFVSIHPYFKVQSGKLDEFQSGLSHFVRKTETETGCLFYSFSMHGDEVFCREGYTDADALLAHLSNINAELGAALEIAELTRLEIHGPAAELAKLRTPLAHLPVAYFETATR